MMFFVRFNERIFLYKNSYQKNYDSKKGSTKSIRIIYMIYLYILVGTYSITAPNSALMIPWCLDILNRANSSTYTLLEYLRYLISRIWPVCYITHNNDMKIHIQKDTSKIPATPNVQSWTLNLFSYKVWRKFTDYSSLWAWKLSPMTARIDQKDRQRLILSQTSIINTYRKT